MEYTICQTCKKQFPEHLGKCPLCEPEKKPQSGRHLPAYFLDFMAFLFLVVLIASTIGLEWWGAFYGGLFINVPIMLISFVASISFFVGGWMASPSPRSMKFVRVIFYVILIIILVDQLPPILRDLFGISIK